MEKQVIYFEAVYTTSNGNTILEGFKCADTYDYRTHLRDLHRNHKNVQVLFREWDNGEIEDGELDD